MRYRSTATALACALILAPAALHAEPTDPASGAPPAEAITETPAAPAEAAAPAKPSIGAIVRARLDALPKTASAAEQEDAEALKAFYEARGDAPLWISDGALNDRAVLAIAELGKADDWGLDASAFEVPDVAGALDDEEAAEVELRLSTAALTYARHARGGRITEPAKQLSSYLDREPQLLDPAAVLKQLAASTTPDATLRGFHPKHPQFAKLRKKYLELRQSADAAAEIVRLPRGPALSPGQTHEHVALLRARLEVPVPAAGDDGEPADPAYYDETLAEAVRAFQEEKGLAVDGIVGGGTRAALNDIDVPDPAKVRANMELWRWIPDDLGDMHVWVNLPAFEFQVVKDGAIIHEERVITGLVDKQTPVFSADMDMVTVHPKWYVPNSIKVRELYPSLARGGTAFQKQGLRLSQNGRPINPDSVDWSQADIRRFDVHQPPGPGNVLGLFKFTFHNKHIVYMHDTPTKNLFNSASRTFSHGCVRVQDPVRFAEIILAHDKGWTPEDVARLVNAPPVENPIPLESKIPVHMVYFTQWIDDDGELVQLKDVYGHEQRVMLALEGRFNAIARGPDHLAPVTYPQQRYVSGGNALETFFNNLFSGF